MTQQYRVAEFAKLGGVTVRTLQYYDRLGLLKPSTKTEGGHRLYMAADLLRLQQVVTLKWMGFPLEQIKTILNSPSYDLKQALVEQKVAIEAQITLLQATTKALQTAINATDAYDAEEIDLATIQAIIRGVTHRGDFMDDYYSKTSQAGIALRAMALKPSDMEAAQEKWQALYAGFEHWIDEPLDHPEVQRLAAEMDTLLEAFTGGDAQAQEGLQRLVKDAQAGKLPDQPQIHQHFTDVDSDLRRFMRQALQHYRTHRKNKKRT